MLGAITERDSPLVVDVQSLEDAPYELVGEMLRAADREVGLSAGGRGWIRRIAPPGWRRGLISGSREAVERSAWTSLIVGIAGSPGVEWLTPLDRLVFCENKLIQGRVAQGLGVSIPRTAVVSLPEAIPAEFGENVVVKPLGSSHFAEADQQERVVWAESMSRRDERLKLLDGAPFLVQEHLVAEYHLRVVTVAGQAWSCALDATNLPVDWRRHEAAHHSFVPFDSPDVCDRALMVAAAMSLGYSSQDWLLTGDDAVLLDVNPAGQWLFLEEHTASEVTASIAQWLGGHLR
ncbi:MAG TPA: hypothetical protein VFF79_03005 [Conexibacter sp.]|nr:hypothetical protein [Conexibacter sp.]